MLALLPHDAVLNPRTNFNPQRFQRLTLPQHFQPGVHLGALADEYCECNKKILDVLASVWNDVFPEFLPFEEQARAADGNIFQPARHYGVESEPCLPLCPLNLSIAI